ncbi:hypothetical protein TELCIR_21442, partial [Teladorsagia circumcincta]
GVYRELDMEKLKEEKEREDSKKKKRPKALPPIKTQTTRVGLTGLQTGLPINAFLSFPAYCNSLTRFVSAVDSPGVLDELDKMMAVALRPAETSPTHKENNGSPTTDELLARLQQY